MDFHGGVSGVFFIESLGAGDAKTGRWMHEHIRPRLQAKSMYVEPSVRRPANRGELAAALNDIAALVQKHRLAPALQIDAHGNAHGIGLSDGDLVPWNDLAEPMRAINEASENRTLLCSAMCRGGHLGLIAMSQGLFLPTPYWATIGPMHSLTASAVQAAFSAFWDEVLVNEDAPAGIRSFSAAAGGTAFVHCEMIFGRVFMRYLLDAVLDPAGLDERVQRVYRQMGGKAPKEWIRQRLCGLAELEAHYRELHTKYLWLDRFPHHRSRYNMTFADACRLFPQG